MKKLPLHEVHQSLGASFEDSSGWTVPRDYGDKLSEYESVRNNVGIIDLSSRGKLRLSGKDHLKFLQGMLSNDVMKLQEGKGMYATILTVKGRMISDMKVYKQTESVFLDLEPELNHKVSELLTKFRLSYKANIEDVTDTVGLISLQGPNSKKLLEKLLDEKISEMQEYDSFKSDFQGSEITVVLLNRTGEEGFDLYIDNESLRPLWTELINKGEELNIKPVGYDAFNTLRIEAGIPSYNVDMDENNIPIEAGLWTALDFEKGCYVGQEVVARIKWRGHVNWHLVAFKCDGDKIPNPGDEIFNDDKKVGRVTSSTYSPKLKQPICLGYVRRELKDSGTMLSIKRSESSDIQAEIAKVPLYEGSFKLEQNSATS
ncbi:MAG: aminomethyltransferase [Thermodesulfobacteriota bacterium]|nr:MAG: aminomethyltransferase [Thermodesulfobacteriota bacterium]